MLGHKEHYSHESGLSDPGQYRSPSKGRWLWEFPEFINNDGLEAKHELPHLLPNEIVAKAFQDVFVQRIEGLDTGINNPHFIAEQLFTDRRYDTRRVMDFISTGKHHFYVTAGWNESGSLLSTQFQMIYAEDFNTSYWEDFTDWDEGKPKRVILATKDIWPNFFDNSMSIGVYFTLDTSKAPEFAWTAGIEMKGEKSGPLQNRLNRYLVNELERVGVSLWKINQQDS
tara:strand:+ start:6933 stop:7613 length:681 start_codon:yes stop_codon:yes gene_type:complete